MADGLHIKGSDFTGQVVAMKILSADRRLIEIIAKYIKGTENSVWVENPQALQAMVVRNPTTKQEEEQIGMINFMVAGDPKSPVEIERANIMATVLARKEAAEEYNRVSSSIVTVKAPGIIT